MKWFVTLLLAGLIAKGHAQTTYRVSFTKEARLTRISTSALPGISAYPTCLTGNNLVIDKSTIGKPASAFIDSIQELYKQLSVPYLATRPPAKDLRGNLLYITSSYIDYQLGRLKPAIDSRRKAGQWVVFQYRPSYEFLPLELADTNQIISVNSSIHPKGIPGQTADQAILSLAGVTDSVRYSIVRREMDNDIITQHLAATHQMYKGIPASYGPLLREARQQYERYNPAIQSLLVQDTLRVQDSLQYGVPVPYNPKVVDLLVTLGQLPKQLLSMEERVLKDNTPWIQRWLWYTGGKIRLNPFDVFDPTLPLRQVDTDLRTANERLKRLTEQYGSPDEEELTRQVEEAQALENRKTVLTALKPRYDSWIKARSVSQTMLYRGVWHTSVDTTIRWLHHVDATTNFTRIGSPNTANLPDMVAQQDEVMVYVHNVQADDKLSLTSSRTDFTPQTRLETDLGEISAQFSKATKVLAKGILGLVGNLIAPAAPSTTSEDTKYFSQLAATVEKKSSLTRNRRTNERVQTSEILELLKNNKPPAPAPVLSQKAAFLAALKGEIDTWLASLNTPSSADTSLHNDSQLFINELKRSTEAEFLQFTNQVYGERDMAGYQQVLTEFNQSQASLLWLLEQTDPPLAIKMEPGNVPASRTVALRVERRLDVSESSKVSYQLFRNDGKESVADGLYKKYKQVRVLPTIGVGYVPEYRTASIFDEGTGQFKTGTTYTNVEAFLGVKWYAPIFGKKTNPARTIDTRSLIHDTMGSRANRLRGNSFVNTLFLTAGLGVSHDFLRNYYVGFGGDIVPGLSIHMGSNFLFRNYYQLDKGKILNQQERPVGYLYVSLSVDPGIAGSLIKIFTGQ
ncbi:hypothetical protein [uncultured Fibrella sp.]|uniref:hypothetical protein n=1 Tax=uncultured Fibrella sp. TaxID=1284596 RepID=UPI0035CBA93B